MRTITVLSMITLDGVLQAPGAPDEDPSGGFRYGGWSAPYSDEVSGAYMKRLMQPSDLLLGRKTFEIWERYWPQHAGSWPGINEVTKYVFSRTRKESDWNGSVFINDVAGLRQLKQSDGGALQVWGSSRLIQLLLQEDLVDDLWLMIHPLTLGQGKKLFDGGALPAAFKLMESKGTPSGVLFAHYQRAGNVVTGTAGA